MHHRKSTIVLIWEQLFPRLLEISRSCGCSPVHLADPYNWLHLHFILPWKSSQHHHFSRPGNFFFSLLSWGRRYKSLKVCITRLRNSFFPSVTRLLNGLSISSDTVQFTSSPLQTLGFVYGTGVVQCFFPLPSALVFLPIHSIVLEFGKTNNMIRLPENR